MKQELKDKIEGDLRGWEYINTLPENLHGFSLVHEMRENNDMYDIFTYRNDANRRLMTVYFHEETKEYKAKIIVGLTEFCNIDFITADLTALEKVLNDRLGRTLRSLAQFSRKDVDSIVIDKKIMEWEYATKLPEQLEGFSLFIRPCEPLRIINGSYIVFDYSDFAEESNFIIYYNIFRDEFFGEARFRRIPEMNYVFDSRELVELEEKLDLHLAEKLRELRTRMQQGKE